MRAEFNAPDISGESQFSGIKRDVGTVVAKCETSDR